MNIFTRYRIPKGDLLFLIFSRIPMGNQRSFALFSLFTFYISTIFTTIFFQSIRGTTIFFKKYSRYKVFAAFLFLKLLSLFKYSRSVFLKSIREKVFARDNFLGPRIKKKPMSPSSDFTQSPRGPGASPFFFRTPFTPT